MHSLSKSIERSQVQLDALHPKVDGLHFGLAAIRSSLDAVGKSQIAEIEHVNKRLGPIVDSLARVEESSARIEGLAHSLHQVLVSGVSPTLDQGSAISMRERRQAVSSPNAFACQSHPILLMVPLMNPRLPSAATSLPSIPQISPSRSTMSPR